MNNENTNRIDCKIPFIVPIEQLYANEYNPNKMPEMEMSLLKDCIMKYGFLFPIITTKDKGLIYKRLLKKTLELCIYVG